MDIKSNESTPLRPEGDRVINAPLVQIDLPKFVEQIKNEETWNGSDRNAITVFKSKALRIVLIALHKDAIMATHTAPGTISVQVIAGDILFSAPEQTVNLTTGQMLTLHEAIPHSVIAKAESVFLLTISMQNESAD